MHACRGLLRDKTVVLTTNQLQFVQAADLVLFVAQPGGIREAGTYEELIAAGGAFATMMREVQVRSMLCCACCACCGSAGGAFGRRTRTIAPGVILQP